MKCSNCNNIEIAPQHEKCPLCGKTLSVTKQDSSTAYPSYKKSYVKEKRITLSKMCFFLSICAIVVSVTWNVLTFNSVKIFWSAITSIGVLYVWVTIENTVKSKTHIGGKVLFQFICISAVVVTVDLCTGFSKWSTSFVVPFLSVGTTMILTVLSIINKPKWYEYTAFLLAALLESVIPFVLGFTFLTTVYWPSLLAFLYSLITVLGMIIFSDKKFKAEIKKRFHT